MHRAFRTTLATVAVTACLVASAPQSADAAGDPRPPLSDLVSFSNINEWVARVSLLFLRSVVDLTYQDITNDPYANRTTVTGIVIRPALTWDRGQQCRILAEQLSLSFTELGDWDRIAIRLELTGVTAPLSCLPPDAAGMAAISEIANLAADRVFVDIDYRMNSSAMRTSIHATLPNLAAVTADLDFAYVAVREDRDDPVVLELRHAAVMLDDMGLWQKAKKSMLPEITQPDVAAQTAAAGLTELFAIMNPPPKSGAQPQLDSAQAAFVQSAAAQVRQFVAKPGTLMIETVLPQPVRLDEQTLNDPARLFAMMQPVVSGRPATRHQIVPAAQLRAALTAPANLSNADKLRIGQALVLGIGAPRALAVGQALLTPLADAGDDEAALALAVSLQATDPEAAYRFALKVGTGETSGLMDRLEQSLTTPQVLALQSTALAAAAATIPSPHDFVPVTRVRAQALAHLRGSGAVRSYARAYYWALLGKAAGDQAAASIADEIETRMRHRGPAAATAWQAAADQARTDALAHWLAADYPATLVGK